MTSIPWLAPWCPRYHSCLTCGSAPQAPRIVLDGPFGAPAQEHSSYRTIVLIGMGIGITPMLSIMRDTLHNLAGLPRNPTGLEVRPCSRPLPQLCSPGFSDTSSMHLPVLCMLRNLTALLFTLTSLALLPLLTQLCPSNPEGHQAVLAADGCCNSASCLPCRLLRCKPCIDGRGSPQRWTATLQRLIPILCRHRAR